MNSVYIFELIYSIYYLLQRSCGKVMFSQACVIPSVYRGGLHGGGQHTGGGFCLGVCIQGGLHLGVCLGGVCRGGLPRGSLPRRGLHPGGSASGGLGRPPLRFYEIRSKSGRHASYWNAFLFGEWIFILKIDMPLLI